MLTDKGVKINDCVQYILENKVNIDYIDNNGENIMHVICRENKIDLFNKLISLKPNVNILTQDETQSPPLHYAAHNGHIDMVKLLISHGADPHLKNILNESILFDICENGHTELLKYSIKLGLDINLQNIFGDSLLHVAIRNNNIEIAKILLENGININLQTKRGSTALFDIFGHKRNYQELADLLITNKANINITNNKSETILHYACDYEYFDLVEKLIDYGACPFIESKYKKQTVIDILKNNECYRILFKIKNKLFNQISEVNHNIYGIKGINELIISYLM
jgi:ankyrin repeat protein